MSDLTQLIKNIENWAEARNLIEGSTPKKQFIKLMEEFGELCSGVSKNKIDVVKDSIGDCFVVMVILAAQRKKMKCFHLLKLLINADILTLILKAA